MWVWDLMEASNSKMKLEHRINRITSSIILSIMLCTLVSGGLLLILSYFPIHWTYSLIILVVINLIYIWVALIKNFYLKKFKKWKIWILLAIDDKWEYEWYKIKRDLLNELNDSLDANKIEVITVSNYWARKIKKIYKDEKNIVKYHNRIWWMYWIIWKTEMEKNWWYKCYIKSEALVFHKIIPDIVHEELWNDFAQIYLEQIEFDEEYYKSWIEFSAIYNWIVAKYIIWVACLVSWAIMSAWELHKWLEDKLKNIEKINNSNQKINEQYFKQISQKIKIIQYRELAYITFYYYQQWQKDLWYKWLNIRSNLSEKYWVIDAVLQNNLAIYEFLVNKDIKKSRALIKKSGKSWNKWYRYSLVFLDLWNKNYKQAKINIKVLMKKDCNDSLTLNSVLKFIDEVLVEYNDRFEFLYWKALIYYRHKNNIPLAFENLEAYIKTVWKNKYWYETIEPYKLLSELKKTMQIE